MNYFQNLKTSDKFTLSFSLFSFFMLVILLITINITYFFIWYNDQKNQSFFDMEENYSQSYIPTDKNSAENFKSFLLQSDTIIIPEDGDPVCSPGILLKLHDNLDEVQNKRFYTIDETLYFIYSREYEGIGKVKVFFDTTEYISSQIIILKISFVTILAALFLNFFIGKIISRRLLKDLTNISQKLQEIDMDSKLEKIESHGPDNDEIHILATTLNKSFQKIEKQTQNLKQFITDVSHEFKTPLMSLNSRVDLLEKKAQNNKLDLGEQERFFKYIKNQTTKMNELLETLFLLSRYDENIQKFSPHAVNFSDILKENCETFFDGRDHIDVKYKIDSDVSLKIEPTTFNIVLENLLTNAVKFSDKDDPVLEIGCNEKCFWVKDNGIGMDGVEVDKIYDKFYKGNTNQEGFGVGLFLVKRILSLYDWGISVNSQKQKGTKVTIEFK